MNRPKVNEGKESKQKSAEAKAAFPPQLQLGNICTVLIIT